MGLLGFHETFDVIVVGGGHAGCEAAHAAARMGARTALFTLNLDLVAQMSCNPAVGGIAKGHLVREIDALGGIMGVVADRTGIQFRLLNSSRGPAVQAPRCQSDKARYRAEMRRVLEEQPNLFLRQAEVVALCLGEGRVEGVEVMDGRRVGGAAVIVTTGTFLNGLIHIGRRKIPAGRHGEMPSQMLAQYLKEIGFPVGRLKTGTPARLDARTIDLSRFEEQKGDDAPTFFSLRTRQTTLPQVSCHVGYTNERVHAILRENLKESALYGGEITGVGPRYCPSVEDKIVKFPDRTRHQLFLEPEGLDTHEIYLNGMSTSMPFEVQEQAIHAVEGLGSARLIRPGYAIEYDFVDPRELDATLQSKRLRGLFHAGQINGTTGYEEAAAQGIVAGVNAALLAAGKGERVFGREESYIGILVDDLVTRGVDEPYRMFTSRSEFRLLLRIDNADERLSPLGHGLGLLSDAEFEAFEAKRARVRALLEFLAHHRWGAEEAEWAPGDGGGGSLRGATLEQILRRPEFGIGLFEPVLRKNGLWLDPVELRRAEIELKYAGYIGQQKRDAEKVRKEGRRRIPEGFDYRSVSGLSREVCEKLSRVRPADLGMASRIPGVTPAAISILNIHLELLKIREKS